ncbi:UDP-N-acetylmuramoyl-L-alanine--D-glutamate ligase [Candidatus Thiosymbion oneisti]|uniref:UDP-N-acetylmuramoyl-L-alanine--D-glutamate ligase n=1 Tax=Candidatus Thiosymbion oneisti TaxID=589554 RepID=UPI000A954E8D|nr:UDP-N-acetylmuramoyl-L-alanine--D-glutamate ligase [Candidatus Thiosymbion oneisti]
MTDLRHFPKTLILGLGKTGLSCARYLGNQGVTVAVMDSRQEPPGLEEARRELPDLPLFLGGFDPDVIRAAEQLIVSPGLSLREPPIAEAAARGVPVLGDIELFARAVRAPVAAITGSNGKSTVTTLLGRMAHLAGVRAAVGGNLGQPALDLLDDGVQLYVLELSSFQLESTRSLAPEAATVLNVSADHMDRYDSLADYAAAKQRILSGARTAVLNLDDPQVRAMAGVATRDIGFSLGPPERESDFGLIEQAGAPWIARGNECLLPANEVVIKGRHNLANALAALAMGQACGLPEVAMLEALCTFRGLPHRTDLVATKGDIDWYDDSKGTNPGATVAALSGLIDPAGPRRAVLIAGGEGKDADFTPLAAAVERAARAVVLIGRDASLIERTLDGRAKLLHAQDMTDAVRRAFAAAWSGDCVLLSPACASFDMFKDYAHRGRVFAAAVEALEV